ncbi:hypothetical protein HDU87_007930 [Geranomyces variabilis]|uniref:Uncharacterized protein n=1 Tax=Geranomyces variabilis TaxID=109894 RepID=A0AAD5TEJ3_9FUNG|nr:hypothetical protein HDU87_007930 [Geranomyces variabilis]
MKVTVLFALAAAVSAAADPRAQGRCLPAPGPATVVRSSATAVAASTDTEAPAYTNTVISPSSVTVSTVEPVTATAVESTEPAATSAPATETLATTTVAEGDSSTAAATATTSSLGSVTPVMTSTQTSSPATTDVAASSLAATASGTRTRTRTRSHATTVVTATSSRAHHTHTRTRSTRSRPTATRTRTRSTPPIATATATPKPAPPPGKICALPAHAANTDIGPLITALYTSCVQLNPGSTLLIPTGAHSLQSNVQFTKPVPFTLRIDGDIDVPFNPKLGGTMLHFTHCNGITVTGLGSINGNGNLWREGRDLTLFPGRPRLLRLEGDNSLIADLRFINAAKFHITVIGNNNEIRNIDIKADHIGETDGIDISGTNNYVHDVSVENGDECVTVKSPTTNFKAENIICKFTAGCNIGSFGPVAGTAAIDGVYYRNVTMSSSDAGVMLKSYPSTSGYVKNIVYEDFTLTDVAYPIDIDMEWCHGPCPPKTGDLTVQGATFKNFVVDGAGQDSRRPVVKLNCPLGAPTPGCAGVKICGLNTAQSRGYAKDIIVNAVHTTDC